MGATNFGVVESTWLPKWAADNGYDLDAVTTSNNMALERGLTASMVRDLKDRFPDEYPQPINEHPSNRQAFHTKDFDAFFEMLDKRGQRPGKVPARLAPKPAPTPAPVASVPPQRQAVPDPHSRAGKLLATNQRAREHLTTRIGKLNLMQADIKRRTQQILDIDQGTGEPAAEERKREIEATRERIEALKKVLQDLQRADRIASAYGPQDLPRLRAELEELEEECDLVRASIGGERAEIALRHRQIVREFGQLDEMELPEIKETSETDRLLREVAAGRLATIAGSALRLGCTVQQLRDGKKRWDEFPEPVAPHPNKTSGDLYEFRLIEAAAKNHGLVYTDEKVPAL